MNSKIKCNFCNKNINHGNTLILSKTLDIYKIYLKLGIFLIYRGK